MVAGQSQPGGRHELLTFSPSTPHSTVALEDSDVHFVLVKPFSEAAKAAQALANKGTQ